LQDGIVTNEEPKNNGSRPLRAKFGRETTIEPLLAGVRRNASTSIERWSENTADPVGARRADE
jgi:hypothetical protein